VYARRVGDRVLDFGHRGWLYEDSFVFYDRETDSLWVQATGECIYGHYKGTRLERLPATQTTWERWRSLHPDTLVLGRPRAGSMRFWEDSYAGNYAAGKGVMHDHHKPNTFGLAVVLPAGRKLYPFAELARTPLVADRVAGEPVVVVFHEAGTTAVAWDPRVDGRRLDLEVAKVRDDDALLRDRQTHSTWSGLTGRCTAGPSKGKQLRQVTTTQFVVENWRYFYGDAPVYHAPAEPKGARGRSGP
jgi:hypothetical protein